MRGLTADLVVTGRLALPEGILRGGWLSVEGGRIAALGRGNPPDARERFDAGDDLVLPGVIDGQTHAASYGGLAGIESTTRSAVAGGVTTIVDMPYDNPEPLFDEIRLHAKLKVISDLAHCDVALYGTVMPDQSLDEVDRLIAAGIVAFKISYFESHPVRFPRIPANQAFALMQALAPTDIPLGVHNEDQEVVLAAIAACRAAGRDGIEAHSESRPEAAELSATAHFLELGAAAQAHAHIVHLTTASGFDLVEQSRARGHRATGELCVHYLWFDPEDDGAELGALMKVNPPIRPGRRDELWDVVREGRAAFVSSDHSSWPVDNKRTASIFDAGAGVPGLETLLPAFHTGAAARGLDADRMTVRMLCEAPARFFGLWPRKGCIAVGADADLTVYAEGDNVWDASKANDELRWSPYDGRRFSGRVVRTYLRGRLAWTGDAVVNKPGDGIYLPRGTDDGAT